MKRKIYKKLFGCIAAAIGSFVILYIELIMSFPSEIVMFNGETHNENLGAGVTIGSIPENVCTYTATDCIVPIETGEYNAKLKLVGAIPYKNVRVRVTDSRKLTASGELIGLRIHNNGLIVLRTSPIETGSGIMASPAAQAGIKPGDIITEINGVRVFEGSSVAAVLNGNNIVVKYMHNNNEHTVHITPAYSKENNSPKLGIWVRDSTAGVGTMTYIDEEKMSYGALGHGISESETGVMFDVKKGSVEKSNVISVKKGISGEPGEICGSFSSQGEIIGTIAKNCEAGIFGYLSETSVCNGEQFPIGLISQTTTGDAYILSTIDDEVEKYDIKIIRTMPFGSKTKGLMINITDRKLLEKTGGIIQGMSGSPIVQNGRIVGAVTHVLVNDPTRGYGIFIENMLSEAEKIQ